MTAEALRVGIIGTGVGIRTILPGLQRTGQANVVALSGSSQGRVEEVGEPLGIPFLTSDYRELCNDKSLDLICVASPNDLHVEHATAALATEKHVYLEKPTGMDAKQARVIAEAASRNADRLVVVGHQLRFNPHFQAARDAVLNGVIGRVYQLQIMQHGSGFADPNRQWTWEFEVERGGGVRLAMGSHLIDLASFLLERRPVAIAADLDPVHRVRTPLHGEPRDCSASNAFHCLATFEGSSAYLSTTAASHAHPRFDVILYGETGDLTFSLDKGLWLHRMGTPATLAISDDAAREYLRRQGSSIFSTSFSYFAEAIVSAISNGQSAIADAATVEDGVTCVEALDAALRSYQTGTRELLARWDAPDLS